ncbi:MAG: phospholipase D-like domain-containing protein, partial [Actinomycetes bacterium]
MGGNEDALREGIYEDLITPRIEAQLAAVAAQMQADSSDLDNAEAADRLALHLAALVERAVSALPESSRASVGTEIVRKVGLHLADLANAQDLDLDLVTERPQVLRAVHGLNPHGAPRSVGRPLTPLLDTTLLTNARGEPVLGKQLVSEIESADSIDAIIAFIRFSGIRPMLDALRAHCAQGKPLRILTTTYTGSTEPRALEELRRIGADIRVSYDTSSTRLHAKAWLFRRAMANSTAYIGSSNLTHSAQIVGLEWNVRASARRNPGVVSKVGAVFDSYWEGGDFLTYDPAVFAAELERDRKDVTTDLPPFELRPEPFQQRLLEQVDLSRSLG